MPFLETMPIPAYPGLTDADKKKLADAGVKTLKDLDELLKDEGRDSEAALALGRPAATLPALRREIGIATGRILPVNPRLGEALARNRTRLLALGPNPNELEISGANAVLLEEVGRITKEDRLGPDGLAIHARPLLQAAQKQIAAGDVIGAIDSTLAMARYLLDAEAAARLDVAANVSGAVEQTAIALEQVQFALRSDLYYSFGASLKALGVGCIALGPLGGMPLNGPLIELLAGYGAASAAIWEMLKALWAWLRHKPEHWVKELWKVLKKLALLYEFYKFMKRFEGDVVYCYAFCANWADHNVGYVDFWDCVQQCFKERGVELSDALWEALKILGVETVLGLIDP